MTAVVLGLWVIAGLSWVRLETRRVEDVARMAGLQLTMLALLSWAELGLAADVTIRSTLIVSAGFCMVVSARRAGELTLHWNPPLFAYALLLVVSGTLSADPGTGLVFAGRYGALLLLFSYGLAGFGPAFLRRLGFGFAVLLAAMAGTQWVLIPDLATRRIRSSTLDFALEGEFGLGMVVVALAGIGLIMAALRHPFARSTQIVLCVSGLGLLVLSQRRAAIVLLIVLLCGHAAASWRVKWVGLGVAVGVALVLLFSGTVQGYLDREATHEESANAASYRSAIFSASIDRFSEDPLIGGGLRVGDADLVVDIGRRDAGWNSHSELGTALAAAGAVGAALLVWHYVRLGWMAAALRSVDPVPLMVLVGTLSVTPFWRLFSEIVALSLLPLLYVVPATPVRRFELSGTNEAPQNR